MIGEGPVLRATVDPDSAGLGDPVRLRLEAAIPKGAVGRVMAEGDSIGPWQILESGHPRSGRRGAALTETRELTIACFRLGEIGPDSVRYEAVTAPGETLRLATVAPRLRIGGQLHDSDPVDPSAAKEIRDVISTGMPRWFWFAAGGLLVAAGLLLARRLLRRSRSEEPQGAPPGPTPEEEFEAAIAQLLASGLLERGEVQAFYYAVSAAVRRYLERVHGLPLLESTSAEVIDLLAARIEETGSREALSAWLREGDLVKYARLDRLRAEASGYLERSRELIRLLAAGHPLPESREGEAR